MRILIAGLAKTGTTALLYLLKNSLPSVDEVLFEPKTCDADWLAGHPNALAKVILDKQLRVADFMAFERKITIVRDPRDRLISALLYGQFHANYLFDDDKVALVRQCLERKEQDPAAVSLTEILQLLRRVSGAPAIANHRHLARLAAHLEVFDSYCAATPDALLYRYEDLVAHDYRPIEQHLGIRLAGAPVVPEHLRRVERTKDAGGWRHWFTAADVEAFRPVLGAWMDKHGYDSADWRLSDTPRIDPEHCSRYFERLVTESKAKTLRNGPPPATAPKPARRAAATPRAAAALPQRRAMPPAAPTDGAPPSGDAARPARNMGAVARAVTDSVSGWAVGGDTSQPVSVTLLVNGQPVAQAIANLPRPALRARGMHPSGRCGFNFRLAGAQQLRPGDQVIVVPQGPPFRLRNSPCTVADAAADTPAGA